MQIRPRRTQVTNEIGRPQTLASDASQFETVGRGRDVLFLGLGPEPHKLPKYFPQVKSATYVECPDFAGQMDAAWEGNVPAQFTAIKPEAVTSEVVRRSTIIRYRPNMRLFPSFWGPVWARCALPHLKNAPPASEAAVWLPGDESSLLHRELALAFKVAGFKVEEVNPDKADKPVDMPWRLTSERPKLFFSVNFKGLDSYGGLYHLLREAGARVAVWCVDNPFHLLTGIKSKFWTELDLFVTDAWFIEPLKKLGATSVHHLPLAASPAVFKIACCDPPETLGGLSERMVFVGRRQFPKKQEFFAGCRLEPEAWEQARAMFDAGQRPDFGWWADRLGVQELWPGNAVRGAGYGAEESGRYWRELCLQSAGPELTVFGDQGWADVLGSKADLRGTLDYYDELPHVYRTAAMNLNMTSPLLPSGLTQRHFDVWVAGGFLLTDATPGLSIFPEELWRPVAFERASDIPALFARYSSSASRAGLKASWAELIKSEHTYKHRVRAVLDVTGL